MQILTHIDVDNLERTQTFQVAALGLTPGRRLGPDMAELPGGTSPLHLLRKATDTVPSPGTAQRRDYQRHWSPVHLDFVVDDLDVAVQRAPA